MNIKVDTHSHTLVSGHAYNTIQEMAKMAKEHGMEAIAFTEHAPEMPGTCGIFYFENLKILPRERYGIKMLFGTELNIMDSEGTVDMRDGLLKHLDIVIASIHTPCFCGERTKEAVTRAYVNVMKNQRENADENIRVMLEYCKKYEVPITTGSDSHLDLDAGKLNLAEQILAECHFPEELIVTTSLEKLKPYVNRYKKTRL